MEFVPPNASARYARLRFEVAELSIRLA